MEAAADLRSGTMSTKLLQRWIYPSDYKCNAGEKNLEKFVMGFLRHDLQPSRAWKPGRRPAHHPRSLGKGGCWEKHHLHGAGPGPAPRRQEALIKQFVSDVAWGQLDYLVVDTPPGTSDEHMAVVDALRPYSPLGALVVTTPQAVSVGDVRRELTFCKKVGLRVIGVVENMSGFVCPHCAECTNIFSRGGGEELARHAGVPFLGSVPLDPELTRSLEEGRDFIQGFPESPAFPALSCIAQKILNEAPVGLC
ncbi:cytosolic Fe-S cluster assembly factor NUBP2 isoform X3 [Balaenoptera acutorostrata]|uniref:Cytosolic Fe-S cluster assembly factor NUBP2 isoform X3 n=1 Tax=Balaenoptera acutorostrata TaxID=9767 RepID=A0A384A327_BALAC|nr:cytosolic Fe-S cluster assembly factor NUBP2 isoform X3 [Balaenoptera acutorostrata]